MVEINIDGLVLTKLRIIQNPLGDIFHGIKKSDLSFINFGEAYFSSINYGAIKGWNKHRRMTLNLIVPRGEVAFVIIDKRVGSISNGNYFIVKLSKSNYQRLTVPPDLWVAFKGKSKKENLILNVADMEHDSNEIDRLDLDQFDFDWDSL